jgi:hypothetical protein
MAKDEGRNTEKGTTMKLVSLVILLSCSTATASFAADAAPARIIFDTDVGNDVDDVLALSVLHALQSRGECEILAVTVTRADELAGPFVDAMDTFYGRPNIPIGCIKGPLAKDASKFLKLAEATDEARPRFPHHLNKSSDSPAPATLLRTILSQQPDQSVTMVQVGFFSNFAALLETSGDATSPLTGRDLVKQKVKFLSVMAGAFRTNAQNPHFLEFNVIKDVPSAQKLARDWPTPIVWSGFEIGVAVPYPAVSIERDFAYVPHHPAAEAYRLYNPPPHERPCWDLTSALYAVLPERGYFGLSAPGNVSVEADGFTRFTAETTGRDRYLTLTELQIARVKEALVQLASQPPRILPAE